MEKVGNRWRGGGNNDGKSCRQMAGNKYFIKISWGKGKLDRIQFKTLN